MKTIVLFDNLWIGHHPAYFKLFAQTLLNLGYRVLAFCPNPEEVRESLLKKCPDTMDRLYTFKLGDPDPNRLGISQWVRKFMLTARLGQTFAALLRWRTAARLIKQASLELDIVPDIVFFAWIDNYLGYYLKHKLVDRIFPYNWSGLYFLPSDRQNQKGLFSPAQHGLPLNSISLLKSPHCLSVGVMDEIFAKKLRTQFQNKSVAIFPDVTDESPPDIEYSLAKQIKLQAGEKKIISLLGSQCKRKGLLTLLEVAKLTTSENWFFVCAGVFEESSFLPDELKKIHQAFDNCWFHWQAIPDGCKFNALVAQSDVLFAVYNDFPYSSNILTKAALFEKPVIASKNYCMGKRVEKFGLGLTIEEGDVFGCIEALHYLCNKSAGKKIDYNFEEYRAIHSARQ
ncbi:MAG: glycosyltransferase family 1 protein, partial [Cyanobacteria bacterium J083]